jgi:uncharacterized protein YbjQ (UPF0145 family)
MSQNASALHPEDLTRLFVERAKKEGKNAVVGIETYYDADTKSGSRNECLCIGEIGRAHV